MIINEKYIADIDDEDDDDGTILDIKVCTIDKNFNAVGVYGCNVKDTIIKNCRTWLRDAKYKGLL